MGFMGWVPTWALFGCVKMGSNGSMSSRIGAGWVYIMCRLGQVGMGFMGWVPTWALFGCVKMGSNGSMSSRIGAGWVYSMCRLGQVGMGAVQSCRHASLESGPLHPLVQSTAGCRCSLC